MPFFSKVQSGIEGLFGGGEKHSHTHMGAEDCSQHHLDEHVVNRYHSFAAPSHGRAKYYVDGASYFWAVAEALKGTSCCWSLHGGMQAVSGTDPNHAVQQRRKNPSTSSTGG